MTVCQSPDNNSTTFQNSKKRAPSLRVSLSSPRQHPNYNDNTSAISGNHFSGLLSKEAVEYIFTDWLNSTSYKP